ncbi:MAG: hypothetical protein AAF821_13680 [Cyanobacteria bacterium P01_D01_bin.156]
MFPLAFIVGMRLWPWVSSLVAKTPWLFRKAKRAKQSLAGQGVISSCTFVLTSVVVSMVSGLILTPPSMQVAIDPGYKILIPAGIIYGMICWVFIQLGYLKQVDA